MSSVLLAASRGNIREWTKIVPGDESRLVKARAQMSERQRTTPEGMEFLQQEALADLSRVYKDALDKNAALTESKLTGMENRWQLFRERVYASGFGEAVGSVVDEALAEFDRLQEDGTIGRWATNFGRMAETVGSAFEQMIGLVPAFLAAMEFAGVAIKIAAITAAIAGLIAILSLIHI